MNAFVPDSVRDQVINQLLMIPENKVSFFALSTCHSTSANLTYSVSRFVSIAKARIQSGVQATLECSFAISAHLAIETSGFISLL